MIIGVHSWSRIIDRERGRPGAWGEILNRSELAGQAVNHGHQGQPRFRSER